MDSIWTLYGLYMDSIWTLYGLYIDSIRTIWTVYGLHMDYGLYMDSIWTLYGLYMDSIWTIYGLYMDSIWTPKKSILMTIVVTSTSVNRQSSRIVSKAHSCLHMRSILRIYFELRVWTVYLRGIQSSIIVPRWAIR
jgi:hypothetical protein